MFSSENISEIFTFIRQNKTLTIMTGFGVAWGVFILVILLGGGQGLQNRVLGMFSVFAQKSIYVYGGKSTSISDKNLSDIDVDFNQELLSSIKERFNEISAISGEISIQAQQIWTKEESAYFNIIGVDNDYFKIKNIKVHNKGRGFSVLDNKQEREVAIIGENVANALFKSKYALNNYINISGTLFKVIGIIKSDNIFGVADLNTVYIPFYSFVQCFDTDASFKQFCLKLASDKNTIVFERELRNYLGRKLEFKINDTKALHIINFEKQTAQFESLFSGLRKFIWGIGLCLLLSGMIGVSNIMLIIVKERTNEIGIRKAVGALPKSVISLFVGESVVITLGAGLIGMTLGFIVLQIFNLFIDSLSSASDNILLSKTVINIPVIFSALLLIIISGVIAGIYPAIKASRIQPIDAINYENRG